MGWLDANEYFFMERLARDRIDGLGATQRVATRLDRDAALVDALRREEPAAAERLVAAYGDRAYRLASRITGNSQDAEEVVQDAFLAVVRKVETFRAESAFGSWLYRIIANAAYQKLRARHRQRNERSLEETLGRFDEHGWPISDWSTSLDDPSIQAELRQALTAAIDELPDEYRTVVLLHDVEGFSNREISAALSLSVPGVKSRVHRARLHLRRRLGRYMAAAGGRRARRYGAWVSSGAIPRVSSGTMPGVPSGTMPSLSRMA